MIQYRKGVFETNSSSSHSICINNDKPNELCIDADNICDNLLNGRGAWKIKEKDVVFGRSPFRYLSTFSEKVLYAIANHIDIHGIEEIVKKYVPEFSSFVFVDYDKDRDNYWAKGYTDDYILQPWLNSEGVSLEDFLTNHRYFVVCDGDEYNIFSNLVNLGICKNYGFNDIYEEE